MRRDGVVAHQARTVASIQRQGLLVTSPVTTFVDLAAHVDDPTLLACGDGLVRRHLVSVDELGLAVDSTRVRRGIARARRVAALVRAGVDSPMESRLRLLLGQGGLPSRGSTKTFMTPTAAGSPDPI